MSHPRKAILPLLILALVLISPQGFAQASGPGSDLKDGIDQFRNGQYDKAILLFHNIILDPNAGTQKAAAYLLIAKSYMATGKLDDAEHNLEFYLATYPGAADYEEASYQKGRLLFMQEEYESAIQVLQAFITEYPKSSFVSSAWFWAGESMYGLGRLDDALAVYQKIATDFPTSAKVEAAQYKASLIQLRKKEVELSKLLKWSHEDFLKSVEEYQNRERHTCRPLRPTRSAWPRPVRRRIARLSPTSSSSLRKRRMKRPISPPSSGRAARRLRRHPRPRRKTRSSRGSSRRSRPHLR
jgi:TolA-binding protein